jgi:hypothetical protein
MLFLFSRKACIKWNERERKIDGVPKLRFDEGAVQMPPIFRTRR